MKKILSLGFILMALSLTKAQTANFGMKDSTNIDQMIGQMIMVGINDIKVLKGTEDILYAIDKGHIGGVVLYEKNISPNNTASTLKKLITGLQINSHIPLFISIDEEGGKVSRLKSKYGFPETVSHAYLGKIGNRDSTYRYAYAISSLLDSVGINLNYAPDIDVNLNPSNPVIGAVGRSFSADYDSVTFHANYFIKAHRDANVGTVLKHFPGHGSSRSDSHYGIADVSKYWNFDEIRPYKQLIDSGRVDAIMTAHIINSHLDSRGIPATLSDKIINGLLREYLDFQGVVFSDDMQMHAISKHFGFEKSIIDAINAGVDVVMFANNVHGNEYRTPEEIFSIIKNAYASGKITEERIRTSYARIIQLKSSLKMLETQDSNE